MNIENLTKEELRHLTDMVQDVYSDIMLRYNMQTNPRILVNPEEHTDLPASTLRERGFVACGILVKLIKAVHEQGLCKDSSCVPRAEDTYKTFFKKEVELDEWWVKRISKIEVQTTGVSPRSNSFVLDLRKAQPKKKAE